MYVEKVLNILTTNNQPAELDDLSEKYLYKSYTGNWYNSNINLVLQSL